MWSGKLCHVKMFCVLLLIWNANPIKYRPAGLKLRVVVCRPCPAPAGAGCKCGGRWWWCPRWVVVRCAGAPPFARARALGGPRACARPAPSWCSLRVAVALGAGSAGTCIPSFFFAAEDKKQPARLYSNGRLLFAECLVLQTYNYSSLKKQNRYGDFSFIGNVV